MAEMFDIVSNITSFKKYTDISNRNPIALPINFEITISSMFSNGSSRDRDKVFFPWTVWTINPAFLHPFAI